MASASATSSSSGGGGGDATLTLAPSRMSAIEATTVAPKEQRSKPGDSCAWYANNECYIPRTCVDCLNVALPNDKCAVDPNGMCVPMTAYAKYAPTYKGRSSGLGFNGYFPAANFTYCSVADATCNACKSKWREEYWRSNEVPAPTLCRGTDGCVCISNCELPSRADSIVMNMCGYYGFDREKLVQSAYIGAGVFTLMVVLFFAFKSWAKKRHILDRERADRERQERREQLRQQQRDRPMRTGPALALGGWNSLRDKLLESERLERLERGQPALAGVGAPAPARPAASDHEGSDGDASPREPRDGSVHAERREL